jgi:3-oxoadipate enol-lactonase
MAEGTAEAASGAEADVLSFEDSGGSGLPAVLLHAFPLDHRMWRRQRDALARRGLRSIAVDLPGFGGSRRVLRKDVDAFAAEVVRVLDHLGVPRAVVVGLSMGGYVAMALARSSPLRVAGLMLANTRANADTPEAKQGRAVGAERARREGVAAVFDAMTKAWPPHADPAHVAELREIAAEQSPEGVVAALEMMRDRPDADLSSLRVPTTVVVGSADEVTPPALAEVLARAIPGAELHVLEGAGHFTQIERSAAFDDLLVKLCQRAASG